MKIALEITSALDSSKRIIMATFPDFIAFEKKFSKSVAKFEAELTLTDLAYIAWHSEHRQKNTGLDFDSWINDVESLELGNQADAVIVPLEISQPIG
jgi:hypothetical protein